MHWLADHAPKSGKYVFTKFGWLTGRDPSEGVKVILNLHFLIRRRVLRKNQGGLLNGENCADVIYLILGALVGRARPKICSIIISQTWSADCNRP